MSARKEVKNKQVPRPTIEQIRVGRPRQKKKKKEPNPRESQVSNSSTTTAQMSEKIAHQRRKFIHNS
jgi:hypothetical protein